MDLPVASWRSDIARALGLAVAAAVALGFSRFAYALLLPPMREDLGLSYAEAGSLNAANGVGYVVGALLSAPLARRFGVVPVFRTGLAVSALALVATAFVSQLSSLFLVRTIGGLATALAFILGAALVSAVASVPSRSGTLVGIYMAGAGAGIVVSGIAVPVALGAGVKGWHEGWIALGALSLAGLLPAWWATRLADPAARAGAAGGFDDIRGLVPTALGYTMFGAGYAGFLTFIIAYLRAEGGGGLDPTLVWVALGLAATLCTLFWGRFLARLSGGHGPALVYGLLALGTLPLLLAHGTTASLATALVFGGCMMAGPASITIVAKQQVSAASLPLALSVLTVCFAFGQAVGPVLSGWITDVAGSVSAGLWTAPAILGLGSLLALLQAPASRP